MGWFTRLYDHRIVNVNVNIVVAGILALGITVGAMHLADRWGLIGWLDQTLPVSRELIINTLTFGVDIIADVAAYFVLHWLANHMPRRAPRTKRPAYAAISFVRDATLVQFERAILSPLLYLIALGTQHAMLKHGYTIATSTAVGFAAGIGVVRVLHSGWMVRNERRAVRGNKDILSVNPWVEHAITWIMPKPATPGARADSTNSNGNGCGTTCPSDPSCLAPAASELPSSADPALRPPAGAPPTPHDRSPAPTKPPRASAKTPT